jgi:hypothetical protein
MNLFRVHGSLYGLLSRLGGELANSRI